MVQENDSIQVEDIENNDVENVAEQTKDVKKASKSGSATSKKKAEKVKHDPNELIPCRSVTFGELILVGPKTNMVYSWANEGDIMDVEYQDLLSLKTVRSNFIFRPYFIIEDEDLREEWARDLDKVYDKIDEIDIAEIFNLPHRSFVAKISSLPDGIKESVKNTAYSMLKNGDLYDLRKIKAIDEVLGTELMLMIN